MSLRARVGRHTNEGGRQCQNWADDQQTVTDLLNRIAVNNGGAGGSLKAPIREGTCGDALYAAIQQFEAKHFPRQRNGYVDPGGAMLKRMEDLAPAAETRLDILRRNVLNIASVVANFHGDARWAAGDRVQLDRLVQMVVNHIDTLKGINDQAGKPLETLPWWGEVFGRVFADQATNRMYWVNEDDKVVVDDGRTWVVDALTQYGTPVLRHTQLVAVKIPALVLFNDGVCFPMHPKMVMSAAVAHEDALDGFSGY
jgi:hypothetical protein